MVKRPVTMAILLLLVACSSQPSATDSPSSTTTTSPVVSPPPTPASQASAKPSPTGSPKPSTTASPAASKPSLKPSPVTTGKATPAASSPKPDAEKFALDALNQYLANDYLGSIKSLNQAIALNPKKAIYWRNRGEAKHAQGDEQGAIADLKKSIELYKEQGDANGVTNVEFQLQWYQQSK